MIVKIDDAFYDDIDQLKSSVKEIRELLNLSNINIIDFYEQYKKYPVSPMGTVGTEKCLGMISSKWKYSILIRMLKKDTMRYGEIKKELENNGITNYMLTKSLKELEKDRLITRKVLPEVPPHTEYSVTKKAIELLIIFIRMTEWYVKYQIIELSEENNKY